jgi:hypothetical protein
VRKWPVLLLSVLGCLALFSHGASGQSVEEIRIVRSIRVSRVPPSSFCSQSRTTFRAAQYEDRYSFAAVRTRSTDGVVLDAVTRKVGSGRGCLGPADSAGLLNIYLEVELSGIRFAGVGKCTSGKSGFPEPGLNILSCFADLTGVTNPYIGGLLTTNTLLSRTGGAESDPPGYVQASIATVRLWKRRKGVQ